LESLNYLNNIFLITTLYFATFGGRRIRRQKAEVRRQEAGGRRQKAGGRRQEAEGRRQEVGGRRQEAGGRRQGAGGRRQEAGGRRQEAEGRRPFLGDFYTLLQQLFAVKGVSVAARSPVLDTIVSITKPLK
jgi:hypothetical protein